MGIISSAFALRETLSQIFLLIHANAARIFPSKIHYEQTDRSSISNDQRKQKVGIWKSKPTVHDEPDPEKFPGLVEKLAIDIVTFLNCLNEFPDYTDEVLNHSMRSFEGDLRVSGNIATL